MSDLLPPATSHQTTHAPAGRGRHPAIFLPEAFVPDEEEGQAASRAVQTRGRPRRAGLYAASVVGTVAVAAAAYALLVIAPSGTAKAAGESSGRTIDAAAAVTLRADSLALAIAAFDLRLNMMEHRQMGCPELARGLIQVEELWISYSLARRTARAALDRQVDRDTALFASVTAVERRFERAGCARP